MYKSGKLLDILKKYLGPDICVFNKKCSYIVDPSFKNYSTKLSPHVDGWVGNSVDMLQVNTFVTKADKLNSMIFYPQNLADYKTGQLNFAQQLYYCHLSQQVQHIPF